MSKPPPKLNNNNNNNGGGGLAAAAGEKRKRGMDIMLNLKGKSLPVGGTITFQLVKGPSTSQQLTADPVDPKAPGQAFPLLAKFPESVVKPKFTSAPWKDGRLYQQDVPKPVADSDEEDNAANEPKKRWKYNRRRNEVAPRQWVLQEQVDFLETMVAKRERRTINPKKLSSRYEGMPEHNPSHYVLLFESADKPSTVEVVSIPAPNGTVAFAQPASRKTYSLSEAEQVIQDSRAGIRTMHHHNVADQDMDGSSNKDDPNGNGGGESHAPRPKPLTPAQLLGKGPKTTRSRLMDKLKAKAKAEANGEEDEADDIMADVTFRNRKGTGGGARKELLETLGDGLTVSEDGVLGGTNDAAFGGRQRFANFKTDQDKKETSAPSGAGEGGGEDDAAAAGAAAKDTRSGGNDGMAMADDFYQRDVSAEYEELDYDANEMFDDDDVDLEEGAVAVDGTGFGDDEEEEDLDEMDNEEEHIAGAEGLATVAGFKAMLAKARGEVPNVPTPEEAAAAAAAAERDKERRLQRQAATPNKNDDDHWDKFLAAAAGAAKSKSQLQQASSSAASLSSGAAAAASAAEAAAASAAKKKAEAAAAIQVDENGMRIISLESVRREIWLNHGAISMIRLMKKFDIKKKSSPERTELFRAVVKELCTMTQDPINGRMLVLKQHYSTLG